VNYAVKSVGSVGNQRIWPGLVDRGDRRRAVQQLSEDGIRKAEPVGGDWCESTAFAGRLEAQPAVLQFGLYRGCRLGGGNSGPIGRAPVIAAREYVTGENVPDVPGSTVPVLDSTI
jgi:hypothetical protein